MFLLIYLFHNLKNRVFFKMENIWKYFILEYM
jgi:hypothetical protein